LQIVNKYRASIATAVLGVVTLSQGQTMGRSSFSSSMIASAFSKFHGVKAPSQPVGNVVATSAKVLTPTKAEPKIVVKADAPVTKPVSSTLVAQAVPTAVAAKIKPGIYQAKSGKLVRAVQRRGGPP